MQRRMMKLHSVGGINGSNPLVTSSSKPVQLGSTAQNWAQQPQSPNSAHTPGKSQFLSSAASQIQQMPVSNLQGGIMTSSNAQHQQIRFNSPVAGYPRMFFFNFIYIDNYLL